MCPVAPLEVGGPEIVASSIEEAVELHLAYLNSVEQSRQTQAEVFVDWDTAYEWWKDARLEKPTALYANGYHLGIGTHYYQVPYHYYYPSFETQEESFINYNPPFGRRHHEYMYPITCSENACAQGIEVDGQCTAPNLGRPRCESAIGNPIDAASGNKYEFFDELFTGNNGVQFSFSYNSLHPLPSLEKPLGPKFTHFFERSLEIKEQTIRAHRHDGRILGFVKQGAIWVSANRGANDSLEQTNDGFRLISKEGWVEKYSTTGDLIYLSFFNGGHITLLYEKAVTDGGDGNSNTLDSVTDHTGRTIAFLYFNPTGRPFNLSRIFRIDFPGAYHLEFDFDQPNGRLRSIRYPDGTNKDLLFQNSTIGINYYALLGIVDESKNRFSTFEYNKDSGLAIRSAHNNNASSHKLFYRTSSTTVTNPLGAIVVYQHQKINGHNLIYEISKPGAPGCGASLSKLIYDSNGSLTSTIDFSGSKTCHYYDQNRDLETVRVEGLGSADACPASPAGYSPTVTQLKTSTEWHPVWRLKVREAQPNRITTWVYHGQPDPTAGGAIASCAPSDAYVYDTEPIAVLCKQVEQATTDTTGGAGFGATASGAPRTWSYTWNRHGQMLTANGPRTDVADITTYEYYPDTTANWTKGDLKTLTNALGQVWSFTQYDAAGRLLSMTDPNGIVTTQTWHPRGWLTSRTTAGATESWSYYPTELLQRQTLPDGRYYDYTWDDAHRLTDITDALGNRTHYTLDAAGNVTQVDVTDAGDQLARQQRTEYDALGRPWKRRDASGNVTEQRHDAMNRLNKLIDPKNRETDYQWDALGRLRQIEDAQQPVRGVTQAQYDGQDQLKSLTAPNGAHTQFTVNGLGDTTQELSPDRGTLTYTHDAAGNVTQRTDGVGRVTGYTWDALNRPLTLSYRPSAGGAVSETVTYTWDASAGCSHGIGRLCAVSDGAGSTTYSYNDKGHLVSATRVEAGQTHVTQYVRDLSGQVLSWVDPASSQFSAWRALDGQIRWQTVQRPGQSALSIADLLGYDAAGSLTDSVMGAQSGSSEWLGISRQYDADGRLADSLLAQISPSLSTNWTRTYAVPGESVEVSVTIGPVEARGTLVMCATSGPCAPQHVLGSLEIDAGGTYALQSLAALPLGIYNARVRFEPAPPFKSASDAGSRPVFIGVPPSQLIDDLLQ